MRTRLSLLALLCALLTVPVLAQNGDRPNEEQPDLPGDLAIPPAPALGIEDALKTFQLPPGFVIEAVASEPLVQDPVCMAFDADGRMWVAEMIAYMPNVDGTGEEQPNGRIAVLRDTDGDGIYDARHNFLEGLILPRAVLPYRDGALVISPPTLAFYRDTDGDGKADTHEVIAKGLGGVASPEHAINGLRWTQDNWIQCSNHRLRFKQTDEGWITQRTTGGGQWGLAFDELGRAFFNTNSDGLRGDTFSSHYAVRNSSYGTAGGMNIRVAQDQSTWPSRITPGVNRGYRAETLRDDYTLRNFTGACGPLVYLGAAFPSEFHGNAFVAEPCGNLVKRFTVHETGDLGLEARNAYDGREFLTSTDERFRPVNLYDGPDGGLYVVDMYRGLIQHRLFVTSWLRRQVEQRGLATPVGMGRIWRVRHTEQKASAAPELSAATWSTLAAALDHPNGWWRMTAQRLFVEDGVDDPDAIEVCQGMARDGKTALGRSHALWALQGMGALDEAILLHGLRDEDSRVVHTAMRCSEVALSTGNAVLLDEFRKLAGAASPRALRQLLFSLGEARTAGADALLVELMFADCADGAMRSAVLSGLAQREVPFLLDLFQHEGWEEDRAGRKELTRDLARCISREQRHDSMNALLALLLRTARDEEAESSVAMGWRSAALTAGVMAGRPQGGKGQAVPLAMASEPDAFAGLKELVSTDGMEPLRELLNWITWPGGPNGSTEAVRALTATEQQSFDRGRVIYSDICAACHQSSGLGDEGLAPALRFSPWVLEDTATPIRILLGGLNGPIEVHGRTWNLEMPVYDSSPADVAAVLTYVRREWGHGAEPVTAAEVEAVQKEMEARGTTWSAEELEAARGK